MIEAPAPPTELEFAKFRALIEREAGIFLADTKKPLLTARLLPRLRELGLREFGSYLRRVDADDAERVRMVDRICTNETQFFREPHHLDLLAHRIVPQWIAEARTGRRARKIQVWSAGCSTGEEPYSIAMTLLTALPPGEGWEISILATDLSTRALDRAGSATYPEERVANVPLTMRKSYLLRGVGNQRGNVRIAPEVRGLVRFDRVNLTDEDYPVPQVLDLVFCRNVMIYFRAELRARVIAQLTARLPIGGHLFLGHAESLPQTSLPLRTVIPTVYQRVERAR